MSRQTADASLSPTHASAGLNATSRLRTAYTAVVCLAFLWAAANCAYVYLFLDGSRTYRVESSVWLLAFLILPLLVSRHESRHDFIALTKTSQRLLLFVASAAWLIVLLPHLTYPFLSDDYVFLALYQRVGDVGRAPRFFRPAFALIFLGLARLGGRSPIYFHAVNLLLHFGSAWFVYYIARRFFSSSTPAIVSFAIFLLNPLQLEATLWVSGLQESLWTFCLLAALWVYSGARLLAAWRLIATVGLVICALMAKETAVCFVLLFPAADLAMFKMRRGSTLFTAYITFAAVLVGYLVAREHFMSLESGYFAPPSRYLLKQFLATPYRFFANPWNAVTSSVASAIQFALGITIIVLLFARVVIRGSSPRLLAGPAVMLISTLPVSTLFYVGADLISARYLYFAAFGWGLFVAELCGALRHRVAILVGIVALVGTWSWFLQMNLRPWRTAGAIVTSMRDAIRRGDDPNYVIAKWRDGLGAHLTLKNGVPYDYQGVGVFINGYAEFREIVEPARMPR